MPPSNKLSSKEVRLISSVLEEILEELYGPGFLETILYYLEKQTGKKVKESSDFIEQLVSDPQSILEALESILGSRSAVEIFFRTIYSEVNSRYGVGVEPGAAITAIMSGNPEFIYRLMRLLAKRKRLSG